MNANQVINMVIRMVVNRVIRKGVNSGIDAVGNRMSRRKGEDPDQPQAPAPDAKATQQRMRQTMRVGRRIGKF